MDKSIEKLISLSMQIGRCMAQQFHISHEDKIATMLHFSTLSYLDKNPEATMSDISHYLQSSFSSTTQLIERLHKSGFVQRTDDTNDRRIIHLSLTKDGKKELREMTKKRISQMKKMYANIDEKDMSDLIRIQEKILNGLQTTN